MGAPIYYQLLSMTVQPDCPHPSPVIEPLTTPVLSAPKEVSELSLPQALLPPVVQKANALSTDTELSSGESIFSLGSSGGSSYTPLSGSATPADQKPDLEEKTPGLSESVTPVEDSDTGYWKSLDSDQLTLRLYLQAAIRGDQKVPEWQGLANALRVYFGNSWHKDSFTLKYCEEKKEFLFWNAVADEKWRSSHRGY